MTIVVTGAAGFIGMHVARALLKRGERVVGLDDINDYYDPALKRARLAEIETHPGFAFHRLDIADRAAVARAFDAHPDIDQVVHLAAQAGVRKSLEDPYRYVASNVMGHLVMMEACRARSDRIRHFVYASSSSVYGDNRKQPFSVDDRVDSPQSLYAATKRADELMSGCYVSLFGVPMTGLRFFTVYGPWGRPDMAVWIFTEAILRGAPIRVVRDPIERDFTYIDDIVAGVTAAVDHPPQQADGRGAHRIYNLGNTRRETLTRLVDVIEAACGRAAEREWIPMPPGDVPATWADIEASRHDLGYAPATALDDGVARFVAWYRAWAARAAES
jgi:UDP-glucuronate 4-epimerase